MAARAAADAEAAAAEEEEGDGDEPGGLFAAAAGDAGSGWDTGLLPSPVGEAKICSQYQSYPSYICLLRVTVICDVPSAGWQLLWLPSAKQDGGTPQISINPTQVAEHHCLPQTTTRLLTALDPRPLGLDGAVAVPARVLGALVAAGDHGQVLERRPAALRPRRRTGRPAQPVVRDDDEVVDLHQRGSCLNFAP